MQSQTNSPESRYKKSFGEMSCAPEAFLMEQTGQNAFSNELPIITSAGCMCSQNMAVLGVNGLEKLTSRIEELLSHHEELQAINEELLEANIELQKTNEELNRTTSDLESRNRELLRLASNYADLHNCDRIGTIIVDHHLLIRVFNPTCAQLLHLLPQDLGRPAEHLTRNLTNQTELLNDMRLVLQNGVPIIRETGNYKGSCFLAHFTPLPSRTGQVEAVVIHFSDLSERKRDELKFEYLAHHDPLTKILNRFSLDQRLAQSLEQAKRDGNQLAVLFIDLDRFKAINDSLGHHIGDLLLVEVAARLADTVRGSDVVARLGGDEFVVVLPHIQSVIDPAYLANKILHTLSRPYLLDGHELHNTPSIGISVFPHDGQTVEELLKSADTAMYHAKSRGRNNYQFFMQEMHTIARERLLLEHDLRLAIERNEFILHFHPQIDLASGLVVGVKAMLRWQHPVRGIITPDRFLSIADASGLILRIDNLSLEMACRQLAAWTAESLPRIRIAVKLSAKQFRQKTLPEKVAAIVSKAGVDPSLLELEITEYSTMGNPDETIRQLDRLSKIGLQLAMDNFGAGYSSLGHVKHFPVNRLIIDRSFVKDIETNSGDAAIAAATILLAHSLGKQVTAKGIETEAQLAFFSRQKCDVGQGYHFSRPLPADKAAHFIRHNPARSFVE
ncbi:MAG: EAL domain-containing protein [Desulfuromonadales bacterium]|nr:EAL domain-containing protein [Desulfuromonadales bacterium]